MSTTAALVEGHYFQSYSGPLNSRYANCECGHQLDWDTRDVDHARHLLAVAWHRGATDYATTPRDRFGLPLNEPVDPYRSEP